MQRHFCKDIHNNAALSLKMQRLPRCSTIGLVKLVIERIEYYTVFKIVLEKYLQTCKFFPVLLYKAIETGYKINILKINIFERKK